jgi:TolB-like protein
MKRIRRKVSQTALAGLLFMGLAAGAFAQTGALSGALGKIAVLPFSGGTEGEREGIPELLMITREMMQNFMVMPRTGITAAALQEINFQAMSGMTDADTIAKLGEQLGADYIMAGSIASVGRRNLLIVSIVRIDVIRQVAGVYLIYDSLDELNRDEGILRRMAAELVEMTRNTDENLEKLALLPVRFESGANKQEGDALAQLLAIHFLRAGKYAVYPRTGTLEQVQREYDTQLRGGLTRSDEAVRAGAAVNPPYVLSVISRKIGTETRFNASIISVEGGYTVEGDSELYANMGDGITAMDFLARKLSGQEVTERERRNRASAVGSEERALDRAQEAEERSRAMSEATDRFLRRSSIGLGGILGFSLGGTGIKRVRDEDGNTTINGVKYQTDSSFIGGPAVELRLYQHFLSIQAGVQFLKDYAPYDSGGGTEYAELSFVQMPALLRVNIISSSAIASGESTIGLALFGGIGMNLALTKVVAADEASPGGMSIVAGAELIMRINTTELFGGYQYNGGLSRGFITVDGRDYEYGHGAHSMIGGLRFYIPFRK